MINIGIVGNGVVGSATAAALRDHVKEVRITDRIRSKETHQLSDVLESDLVFLCLPTLRNADDWGLDTSAIEGFFQDGLPPRFRSANFVLKSTVPIGFTRQLAIDFNLPNIVHWPEFLSERTSIEDSKHPVRHVVGYTTKVEQDDLCLTTLVNLLHHVWPKVETFVMSSDESEAVKLLQNSFSAIKIAAFNEFRQLTDKFGLDWQKVRLALLAGGWINPMHTQVPGPDGKRGFGGSCLPKDLSCFIDCCSDAGMIPYVATSAYIRNTLDR